MKRIALAAGLLSCALACTELFDPCLPLPGVVDDLRVLGVSADPPEVGYDLATGAVQPITVRMLVVDPHSAATLLLQAEACAPDEKAGCALTSVLRPQSPWTVGEPITVRVPPQVIAAAISADPLHAFGGAQVRLDLTLTPAEGQPLHARKTLVFRAPDATDPPNQGLAITGLRVRRLSHAHNQSASLYPPWPDEEELAPGEVVHFDVGDKGWLRPRIDPPPEEYETTDFSGQRVRLRERITYTFYSSFGDISGPRTGVIFPVPYFEPLNVVSEPPVAVDPPGLIGMNTRRSSAGVLWVVASDGRGAETWATFPWVARDATLKSSDNPQNSSFSTLDFGPRCAKNQQ